MPLGNPLWNPYRTAGVTRPFRPQARPHLPGAPNMAAPRPAQPSLPQTMGAATSPPGPYFQPPYVTPSPLAAAGGVRWGDNPEKGLYAPKVPEGTHWFDTPLGPWPFLMGPRLGAGQQPIWIPLSLESRPPGLPATRPEWMSAQMWLDAQKPKPYNPFAAENNAELRSVGSPPGIAAFPVPGPGPGQDNSQWQSRWQPPERPSPIYKVVTLNGPAWRRDVPVRVSYAPGNEAAPTSLIPPRFGSTPLLPSPEPTAGQFRFTTDYQPTPVFSPAQTDKAANLAMAQAHQNAMTAGRNLALPGISASSPGLLSRRAIGAGEALGEGAETAQQLRLSDAAANAQQGLFWQQLRAADYLSRLNNALQAQRANAQYASGAGQGLLGAILGMGGLMGSVGQQGLEDAAFRAQQNLAWRGLQGADWLTQMGNMLSGQRANAQYAGGAGQGLLGAILGMGGLTGNLMSDYLNHAAQMAMYGLGGQSLGGAGWLTAADQILTPWKQDYGYQAALNRAWLEQLGQML